LKLSSTVSVGIYHVRNLVDNLDEYPCCLLFLWRRYQLNWNMCCSLLLI